MRNTVIGINYAKLILASIVIGLLASLISGSLKIITDYCQEYLFEEGRHLPLLYVIFPSVGITLIYFLRKYLFQKRQNKGIKEIYTTLEDRKDHLPFFKIPSHYFNGFLTVIFGGSTGIEVSTVVATATIGAVAHKRKIIANCYKTELICAGVSAGIATLFASPLVGFVFAVEVIARGINKTIITSSAVGAVVAWASLLFMGESRLFDYTVTDWHLSAVPYFIVLSIIAGMVAVYFTKTIIYIKERFSLIQNNFIRVNTGAVLVGISILCFPQLFGDSYHAIPELMQLSQNTPFSINLVLILFVVVLLKPLVASLTLGAGGDGGVFAPSIVTGAVIGMLVAVVLNHFFNTDVIVLNFALIGAAAMLSASIHAPFTSIFLACSLVSGGYIILYQLCLAVLLQNILLNIFTAIQYTPTK